MVTFEHDPEQTTAEYTGSDEDGPRDLTTLGHEILKLIDTLDSASSSEEPARAQLHGLLDHARRPADVTDQKLQDAVDNFRTEQQAAQRPQQTPAETIDH